MDTIVALLLSLQARVYKWQDPYLLDTRPVVEAYVPVHRSRCWEAGVSYWGDVVYFHYVSAELTYKGVSLSFNPFPDAYVPRWEVTVYKRIGKK